MVPQGQVTLGGEQCAPFRNYYQEERLCTINSSSFPNVTIFVLQRALFDLDSVKCGIFYVPLFYAVHKTFNLICRTLSLPCIPINCHQISFCACFKVSLSLRLRTCKRRVIPSHIGISFLPPFSSGFDYTCSNNCSFESI